MAGALIGLSGGVASIGGRALFPSLPAAVGRGAGADSQRTGRSWQSRGGGNGIVGAGTARMEQPES